MNCSTRLTMCRAQQLQRNNFPARLRDSAGNFIALAMNQLVLLSDESAVLRALQNVQPR